MRAVRFDEELDDQVRRAAAAEGSTVSEFIRRAVVERSERVLAVSPRQRLGDVIGAVRGGGGQARRTGKAFADVVADGRRKAR